MCYAGRGVPKFTGNNKCNFRQQVRSKIYRTGEHSKMKTGTSFLQHIFTDKKAGTMKL
jgi:hypothetical protein